MKNKRLRQRKFQDQKRRENLAYSELAEVGGYLDHAVKLISLQYLVGSMVAVIAADIEVTLERANLKSNKIISIQNALQKATDDYFNYFKGSIKDSAVNDWAEDLERIEKTIYEFANIKQLRPKRKAMREAKTIIEEKFNVKLEDLK